MFSDPVLGNRFTEGSMNMVGRKLGMMLGLMGCLGLCMAGSAFAAPGGSAGVSDDAQGAYSIELEQGLEQYDASEGLVFAAACFDNGDCGKNRYCAKRAVDCDGPGRCRRMPDACP